MSVPKVDRWLLAIIVVLTVAGTFLLSRPPCRELTERESEYFSNYVMWQAAFDALSATCGVGLLMADLHDDYTETGRWTLVALGALGGLAWLVLTLRLLHVVGASLTIWAAPPTGVVLALLGGLLVLAMLGTGGYLLAGGDGGVDVSDPQGSGLLDALRLAPVTTLSLGLATPDEVTPAGAVLAGFAWLAALGWPVWLFVIPALTRRHVRARQALLVGGSYTLLLAVLAGAMLLLETPRGGVALRPGPEAAEVAGDGYPARLIDVTLAAGAGLSARPLVEQDLRDGSKIVLAMAVLIGPASYCVAGGLTWIMLLWALTGAVVGQHRSGGNPHLATWCSGGLAAFFALIVAAVVGALGLLLIEGLTGSRFEHPPSFADALVDASAAVGGANLTTGLVERVTAENLISGKNLPANAYAFGMGWLMLLMLVGRVAPLVILRRLVERANPDWKAPRAE